MMARGKARGMALLEVLVMGFIALLVAIPIYNAILVSEHEAMTSEDYRLAELVAERAVSEALGLDWTLLTGKLPVVKPLVGPPPGDAAIVARYPEYARIFASQGFKGQLEVKSLDPDLVAIEVHLEWPVKPGSKSMRSYSIVRLRARTDGAIRANWPISSGIPYVVDETEIGPTGVTP
jgi:hypothetical protein